MTLLWIIPGVVLGVPLVAGAVAFWVAVVAFLFGPTIAAEDLGQEP